MELHQLLFGKIGRLDDEVGCSMLSVSDTNAPYLIPSNLGSALTHHAVLDKRTIPRSPPLLSSPKQKTPKPTNHTMAAPTNPLLFCMGNPLLDLQVSNGEALLKKYDLKANDAILAEEKHMGM
jgi:hypothetical protein